MKRRYLRCSHYVVENLELRQLLTTGTTPVGIPTAAFASGNDQDATAVTALQTTSVETNDLLFQELTTSSTTHHDAKDARAHKAKPTDDFSGTWTLSSAPTIQFAQLTLTQTGKHIQGSILDDDVQATVTGKVTGDRLTGRFMSPKTSDHPKIKFKIDATQSDEHSMTGTIKVTAKGIHQTTNFTGVRE